MTGAGRSQVVVVAGAAGVLVGLFSPLLVALSVVAVSLLVAAALGARREGRPSGTGTGTGVGPGSPLPWVVFGGSVTLFWLVGRFGLVLGVLAALALVVLFLTLGGDVG